MKAQAIVPDFFRPTIKEVSKVIKAPKEGTDDAIMELSESKGWEQLRGIIEGIILSLNESTKKSVGKAKTMEEMAIRYLARDISVDSFQSIIDIVELHNQAKYAEKSAGTIEE